DGSNEHTVSLSHGSRAVRHVVCITDIIADPRVHTPPHPMRLHGPSMSHPLSRARYFHHA
ncbi:hypothetical protein PAXRUDRAFT_820999, partial [Paxillus rubicundulus Ve08.2h10]